MQHPSERSNVRVIVHARPPGRRVVATRPPRDGGGGPRLYLGPAAALRAFAALMERNGISQPDALRLLGLPPAVKALPAPADLSEEQVRRIHYLLEIDSVLRLARDQATAARWLTTKDRGALKGDTPVRHMIREGLPGFAAIREMADALANE